MSAPSVYAAIHAVATDLAAIGIPKDHLNATDDYRYRSIDDVLGKLAPFLAKHRLCVLPKALERFEQDRMFERDERYLHVCLRMGFTLISVDDGTSHVVEAYGEALDASDKATAKAMTAAYKSAMIQTFCIPVCGADDADHSVKKDKPRLHEPEPVQGWKHWCDDVIAMIAACESDRAMAVIQERYRALLVGLSREQPELYACLGQSFARRREELRQRPAPPQGPTAARRRQPNPKAAKRSEQAMEHA